MLLFLVDTCSVCHILMRIMSLTAMQRAIWQVSQSRHFSIFKSMSHGWEMVTLTLLPRSAGHKAVDWPKKCFNGRENWALDWYEDRTTELELIDAGHLIKVASFVDYNRTDDDQSVIVKVGDFYLQYNTAKDFNIDTEEKKDQLTVTGVGEGGSEGLAGLSEGEQYIVPNFQNTSRSLVIEACQKGISSRGAAVFVVSISLDASLCNNIRQEDFKELKQTQVLSMAPSAPPSNSPSHTPTGAPSFRPSTPPTSQPKMSPSGIPTSYVETAGPSLGSVRFWNLYEEILAKRRTKPPQQDSDANGKEKDNKANSIFNRSGR